MDKKWSYWGYAMDPNTKEHSKKVADESSREPAGYGAWISVDTRLPADNIEVSIAFWDGVTMRRTYSTHIDGAWYVGDFPLVGGDFVVHYWQPAPPLPDAP